MRQRAAKLKDALEKLYLRYNRKELILPDPLQFVYRYAIRADMEITAFLSAELSVFGRLNH